MAEILLALQVAATLAMFGLIWFVQVVHYPLFAKVGPANFREYEVSHQQRTTAVVAPFMLTEAATATAALWIRPAGISWSAAVTGAALVVVLWASTYWWQVPAHQKLAHAFDAATHRQLVRGTWIRTLAWTARALLMGWMCQQSWAGPPRLP